MSEIRCFVAIEIPDEIKEKLTSLNRYLSAIAPGVKWVRKEGMHLTLKFLGNVDEDRISEIKTALTEAVKGFGVIEAEVESAGAFPNAALARVLWAGTSGEVERIQELASRVETALANLGFEREKRAFRPHITIGRIKKPKRNRKLDEALSSVRDQKFGKFTIREIVLFKSQLHPDGAIYTPLARITLER